MTLRALLLAAAILAPLPALAAVDPTPGLRDSRVRTVPYDPRQITRLYSTGGTPLELLLEAGEIPTTIAGSLVFTKPEDAKDWVARQSGNVLILYPLHMVEPTMLFVRTRTADGEGRYYSIELHTREGSITDTTDRAAYMTVAFVYPVKPSPEAIAAARTRREAREAAALSAASAASVREVAYRMAAAQPGAPWVGTAGTPGVNYAYDKRDPLGCPLLAPQYVWDDGHRTTMIFAPHAVLPELYVINQDGKEGIVTTINDTTSTGLQIVIPSVQREMRLRRGGKVCALRNNAFDPIGTMPGGGSGTISPNVVRTVRGPVP